MIGSTLSAMSRFYLAAEILDSDEIIGTGPRYLETSDMTAINGMTAPGLVHVAPEVAVLRPTGPLDFHTYAGFVEDARRLYLAGSRCLLIDLTEVPELDLAGLMGLYEVVELFDGRPVPDFSKGWVDVHPVLDRDGRDGPCPVEVTGLHRDAARALERAGLLGRVRVRAARAD
jgi:STAS domain